MCLDGLGRTKEAEPYFQRAGELDPHGARTASYLGWHQFQLEDFASARQWFEKSLQLSSDQKINPLAQPYLKLIQDKIGGGTSTNAPAPGR